MKKKAILVSGYHPKKDIEDNHAEELLSEKMRIELTISGIMNYVQGFLQSSIGGSWILDNEIKAYKTGMANKEKVLNELELEGCDFILFYFMGHSGIVNGELVLGLSPNENLLLSELDLIKIKSKKSVVIIDGCRTTTLQENSNGPYPIKVINSFSEFKSTAESRITYDEHLSSVLNAHYKVFSTQSGTEANINISQGHFFSVLLINVAVEWARKENNFDILRFNEALELVEKGLLEYPQESGYCQVPDWERGIDFPLAIKV